MNEKAKATIQKLIDLFESGTVVKAVALHAIPYQDSGKPMDKWSLCNRLLCYLSGTADARGFRQWQQVDRHVVKGAKAIHILGPILIKDDPRDGSDPESKLVAFRALPVFKVDDTDGEPVEYPDFSPPELPPLHEVAEAWGIPVDYAPHMGHADGGIQIRKDGSARVVLFSHSAQIFSMSLLTRLTIK